LLFISSSFYRSAENVTQHISPADSTINVDDRIAVDPPKHEPVQRKISRFEVITASTDVFTISNATVSENGEVQRSQELQQMQLMTLLPTPDATPDDAPVSIESSSNESEEVFYLKG